MKLSEIKIKIINDLSGLTIDDLNSTSIWDQFSSFFSEQFGISSFEEVENYLENRFPETNNDSAKYLINLELQELNSKIESIEKLIKRHDKNIIDFAEIITKNTIEAKAIKQESIAATKTIKEIDKEISVLKKLTSKQPYIDEVKKLQAKKERQNTILEDFSAQVENINIEEVKLIEKQEIEKSKISENKAEIKLLETHIKNTNSKLSALRPQAEIDVEFEALEYLLKLLINRKTVVENEEIKVTKKNIDNYGRSTDEYVWVKTGNVVLNEYKHKQYHSKEFIPFIESLVQISKNIIPINWRNVISTFLNNITNIDGTVCAQTEPDKIGYIREHIKLTNIDSSTLLALRIALKHNYSIKSGDNEINLGMSGGIMANIVFRKKGKLISNFQQKSNEIFSNQKNSERFINQMLYSQNGYANSVVEINTPATYNLLAEGYVIEIKFEAAPILFDNSKLCLYAPNISGRAKKDDEDAYDDDY